MNSLRETESLTKELLEVAEELPEEEKAVEEAPLTDLEVEMLLLSEEIVIMGEETAEEAEVETLSKR